ncbi:hypothetical protein R6Q57_006009 [Mikania cordata]
MGCLAQGERLRWPGDVLSLAWLLYRCGPGLAHGGQWAMVLTKAYHLSNNCGVIWIVQARHMVFGLLPLGLARKKHPDIHKPPLSAGSGGAWSEFSWTPHKNFVVISGLFILFCPIIANFFSYVIDINPKVPLSVSNHETSWMPSDYKEFIQEYRIAPDWRPELPRMNQMISDDPNGKICLCAEFFRFSHFVSSYQSFLSKNAGGLWSSYFSNEPFRFNPFISLFVMRSIRQKATPLLFHAFFKLVKNDNWFSFDKHSGPSMVHKVPSCCRDKN